jgi:hypothetical protein
MLNENNHILPGTVTRAFMAESQRTWLDRYRTGRRFRRGVRKGGLPRWKNLPSYPGRVLVAGIPAAGHGIA